ncbi:glycosyltransferase family 4 protein [Prochlorococcus marinus]|uniref:glycosyltransferase family 4 protein n=1 Tax=Prochlorococcus TaxID=1218 RepID=UPI0007B3EE08|nr:glycosyltransferase family 4 protein [Prochlorococcus marinus]KZR78336.1 GDP-mannose-dependent alpha-(1-6)-phosphatidylinositol monomannoside mannosyltransferase [Prochlorococcus marinus str. MIT 1323]
MKLLFVHQGFPGQYIHILRALHAQGGHELVGLGINEAAEPLPDSVQYFRYSLNRGNQSGLHPWVTDLETKVLRGEPCARAAAELKRQGFSPDLICGHPGWGELLFIKDIWPHTPLLTYQEFFYNPRGFDYDFDPELQGEPPWENCAEIRMKTANQLLNLASSTWCITPTHFQRSTYPQSWHNHISVIHDGIDTVKACPNPNPNPVTLSDGTVLSPSDKLITFVNRTLEPYRGCHSMIRAIPKIQQLQPDARLLIVGETQGVSYGAVCPEGEWTDIFLKEIEGQYDASKVIFAGRVPYEQFLPILQLSQAHVYLTYPFVLSWSLLEAMSIGCAIVGSATAPVKEVIKHEYNGLLVDFFQPNDLAEAIDALLQDRRRAKSLGEAARNTVLDRFELTHCVQQQLSLLQLVANGALGS